MMYLITIYNLQSTIKVINHELEVETIFSCVSLLLFLYFFQYTKWLLITSVDYLILNMFDMVMQLHYTLRTT